jgi:hypothetical protein
MVVPLVWLAEDDACNIIATPIAGGTDELDGLAMAAERDGRRAALSNGDGGGKVAASNEQQDLPRFIRDTQLRAMATAVERQQQERSSKTRLGSSLTRG